MQSFLAFTVEDRQSSSYDLENILPHPFTLSKRAFSIAA